jgi:hypothetical protein
VNNVSTKNEEKHTLFRTETTHHREEWKKASEEEGMGKYIQSIKLQRSKETHAANQRFTGPIAENLYRNSSEYGNKAQGARNTVAYCSMQERLSDRNSGC